MRRYHYLAYLIVLVLFMVGCEQKKMIGQGNFIEEIRNVAEFKNIDIKGEFDVEIQPAKTQKLAIITNENLLPYIQAYVEDGTLYVHPKSSVMLTPTGKQRVIIAMPILNGIKLFGSISLHAQAFNTDSLSIVLNGSHKLYFSGKATQIDVDLKGSSTINAEKLVVDKAIIQINGSGIVAVSPKNVLDVTINGAGKVMYFQKPATIKQNITGSGQILNPFGGISTQKTH